MITRRRVLQLLGLGAAGVLGLGGYAFGIEPRSLHIARYAPRPANWPSGLKLRIAAISDIHACDPWVSLSRIGDIVDAANALSPDIVLLLGDYRAGMRLKFAEVPVPDWAAALARLSAPLGVHAILGNHDWWEDEGAQQRLAGPTAAGLALEAAGIGVYENRAARIPVGDSAFWLAGLGDQIAFLPQAWAGRIRDYGADRLGDTLAQIATDEPAILMAHEPDIFPLVPERVSLTLSGHTHGGQVRLFGYAPVVPSAAGRRYTYGQIVEEGRHLIVSAGIGFSMLPVRFGAPPEIALIDLGGEADGA